MLPCLIEREPSMRCPETIVCTMPAVIGIAARFGMGRRPGKTPGPHRGQAKIIDRMPH